MRQQKYKAYIKELNIIAPVASIEWIDGKIDHIHLENHMPYDIKEIELLEYTGLKDKARTEVFKHSIIKDVFGEYWIVELDYRDTGWCAILDKIQQKRRLIGLLLEGSLVIGSKHTHPELLKYGKDKEDKN